jgi:hypothetical protein
MALIPMAIAFRLIYFLVSFLNKRTVSTEQTYRGINNFIAEFIHDIKDMVIPIQQSSQVALEEANSN